MASPQTIFCSGIISLTLSLKVRLGSMVLLGDRAFIRSSVEKLQKVIQRDPMLRRRLDPLNFASHRFSKEDYAILTSVSVDQPLCEIFAGLVESGDLVEEDAERFYGFIYSLHKIGFLNLPISDEKTLYVQLSRHHSFEVVDVDARISTLRARP